MGLYMIQHECYGAVLSSYTINIQVTTPVTLVTLVASNFHQFQDMAAKRPPLVWLQPT